MHHWKSGTHHQSGGHLCMLLSRENFFSDNRSWKRPFYRRWKIYFESWVEEGWNDKNDCATDNYDLYYKVIVKDFSGNTLSEEVGDLYQAADGTWWIAWLPVALWIKIGYFRYTINVIWAKWYVTSIFSSKNTVLLYEFVWYWVKTILYHTKHPRISIYVAVFQKKFF